MGKLDEKMSNIDNSAFSLYYVAPQSSESGLLPLFFAMVGDEQCAPTYRVYRENADISVLIYVLSGEGSLESEGITRPLHAGDVMVLPQGGTYCYETSRQYPWRILWFNMTGELFPFWLRQYGFLSFPVLPDAGKTVLESFWQGVELCRSGLPHYQIQDQLSEIVYHILLSLWRRQAPSQPIGAAQQLRTLIDDLISADPAAPFSMEEAAQVLNMSQRQLERLFQQEFHLTPYRYFQQQKLLLARQYLRNTRLSIKEISSRLGFCDPYYFSNFFKKEEGISPKKYRSPV